MMPHPVTFEEFAWASLYTDPVDRKKLRFIYRAIEDFAAERRVPTADLSILEVACGVGSVTLPLARLGGRVRAIDIDRGDVEKLIAAARARRLDNIVATVDDAFAFREDARYDVVIASEVIEHVLEPGQLIANAMRHLAPGGLLIVTTPNGYGPWEISNYLRPYHVMRRWDWLRRLVGKGPYIAGTGPDHCHHFTRGRLMRLFETQGLEVHRFANSDFVMSAWKRLRRDPRLGEFDVNLADLVPYWMASGWYVALRPKRVL